MSRKHIAPWKWGGLRRMRHGSGSVNRLREEMETVQSNLNRIFSQFLSGESFPDSLLEPWGNESGMPSVNESEDSKAYHISIELPGMDEKDIELTLSDGILTVRGEKKEDEEEKGKDFYRRERSYGSFYRTFAVPLEIDEANVSASFKKGVLHIDLPKSEEAQKKVKHIHVKAA